MNNNKNNNNNIINCNFFKKNLNEFLEINIIAIAFQNNFYSEMYYNNIFLNLFLTSAYLKKNNFIFF